MSYLDRKAVEFLERYQAEKRRRREDGYDVERGYGHRDRNMREKPVSAGTLHLRMSGPYTGMRRGR